MLSDRVLGGFFGFFWFIPFVNGKGRVSKRKQNSDFWGGGGGGGDTYHFYLTRSHIHCVVQYYCVLLLCMYEHDT